MYAVFILKEFPQYTILDIVISLKLGEFHLDVLLVCKLGSDGIEVIYTGVKAFILMITRDEDLWP